MRSGILVFTLVVSLAVSFNAQAQELIWRSDPLFTSGGEVLLDHDHSMVAGATYVAGLEVEPVQRITAIPTPEPSSFLLAAFASYGLLAARRRHLL